MQRPQSIYEVVEQCYDLPSFDMALKELLDELKKERREGIYARFEREPLMLPTQFPDFELCNAMAAAVAAHFCKKNGVQPPKWVFDERRVVTTPFFCYPYKNMRGYLLRETPSSFSERNIFIDENSLSRC